MYLLLLQAYSCSFGLFVHFFPSSCFSSSFYFSLVRWNQLKGGRQTVLSLSFYASIKLKMAKASHITAIKNAFCILYEWNKRKFDKHFHVEYHYWRLNSATATIRKSTKKINTWSIQWCSKVCYHVLSTSVRCHGNGCWCKLWSPTFSLAKRNNLHENGHLEQMRCGTDKT